MQCLVDKAPKWFVFFRPLNPHERNSTGANKVLDMPLRWQERFSPRGNSDGKQTRLCLKHYGNADLKNPLAVQFLAFLAKTHLIQLIKALVISQQTTNVPGLELQTAELLSLHQHDFIMQENK